MNAVIKAIAKKTGLIDDIVFKTQLLALNDSIEAAKAGEHVRSFSLVSEEVSKLALSSGEAAEKISDLIDQSDIKVTELLSSINKSVATRTEYTESVRDLFTEISDKIGEINSRAGDMNEAAK